MTTEQGLLKSVNVPDSLARDLLNENDSFSFAAGDFLDVYGGYKQDGSRGNVSDQEGSWAAVVTCFFLDVREYMIGLVQANAGSESCLLFAISTKCDQGH